MQDLPARGGPVAHPSRSAGGGVDHAGAGALLGTGAVLVWNDVTLAGREQFYDWHDKEHIPERLAIPGFRRGRRYVNPGHSPEWLTLYEADDLGVVTSPAYLERLNAPTPLTTTTLQYFRNTSRAVCEIVRSTGTSTGGHVLAMRLDIAAGRDEAVTAHLGNLLFPQAMALTGVLACHLFIADRAASHIDTAESGTRTFDVPSWVILVETSTRQAAEVARACIDGPGLHRLGVTIRSDAATYDLEICRLPGATVGVSSTAMA